MNISIREKSLEIRPIHPEEVDAVLAVYRQCEDFLALGPVSTASLEMVEADIDLSQRAGGIFCGIYSAQGKMIGVLDYVPGGYEGDAQAAYLALLMIAAPYRSQGIGKAVVAAVENEIRRDERVTTILAGVQVNNPQAVRFWQNNGYQIVSGPERMPDQTTVFGLRKDVDQQAYSFSSIP